MEKPVIGFLDRFTIKQVKIIIRAGGIAVLPTDTLYGFHCAASRLDAVERIRLLKGKGTGTGFILLASDLDMVD